MHRQITLNIQLLTSKLARPCYIITLITCIHLACAGEDGVHNTDQPTEKYPTAAQAPPFDGTAYIDPDIVTPDDVSTFQGLSYNGRGVRNMYDRRAEGFVEVDAYLFTATYDDGFSVEVQVNPEFGHQDTAEVKAEKYGWAIGQLPTILRTDLETMWIHKGDEAFGGGNNNILIHTGQARQYEEDGYLEEIFVHEACHTSLDADHRSSPGWLDAQDADPTFISTYARDNPEREDIAESFLPYFAIRYRADRISDSLETTIMETIPNRIEYFDNQSFNMYPVE